MSDSSSTVIGVDAGGTLIKIAYSRGAGMEAPHTLKIPTARIGEAADWIAGHPGARVCLTGGKSRVLAGLLGRVNEELRELGEFEATVRGALYLLQQDGQAPDSFILTNAGTGTSVHQVNADGSHRIIGTGIGGGTVLGLSSLLTGEREFDAIIRESLDGDRERVDLLVSHIYEGAEPPIPGDLTASNFGNVRTGAAAPGKADILLSVLGLVGETITTVSVMAAAMAGTGKVVYAGSLFEGNAPLSAIVERYTRIRECEPVMLRNGGFCGAIGAWLSLTR
ncbi:type II pantothenate kinase [Gorillibacterium sp. sgz500922]|uniref:type II pantothenate kinase n=1 Tax=Gorillibacterium sp. sgz500922 TaxID=3446694 RepID=UPI003F670395